MQSKTSGMLIIIAAQLLIIPIFIPCAYAEDAQTTKPAEPATTQTAPASGTATENKAETENKASATAPATDASTTKPETATAKPETPPAPAKPKEEPLPPGFDQAVKAFKEGKYAIAIKQFEGFLKAGSKNEEVHNNLAQCYYRNRQYSKAIKEFDWVSNNYKHSLTTRNQAAENARTLKCYMAGVCPGSCLKANDPRWQDSPGHPGKWIKFPLDTRIWQNDAHYISSEHIGHTITFYKGDPRVGDICPICRGSGRLRVLKDGDPL